MRLMPNYTRRRGPAARHSLPLRPVLAAAVLGVALAASACNSDRLNVPNYNNFTVPGIGSDPTAPQLAVNGIMYDQRIDRSDFNWETGLFGRESYYYFPTDTRFVTDYLQGTTLSNGQRALD